jgi:O-methyltransferase involved in polyketide biosynthesis
MNLSEVSLTAILPLLCRAIRSEMNDPVFNDPMAVLCLEKLMSIASDEEKKRILKWRNKYTGINSRDLKARIMTVMSFDNIARQYISNSPGCTVITLLVVLTQDSGVLILIRINILILIYPKWLH